jgi:hypothetical protein
MYLVVIAWLYVVLMMAVAEATNSTGTVLGAVVTFLLYGLLPVALVVYLMTAPARRRIVNAREAQAREAAIRAAATATATATATASVAMAESADPDAGSETAADPVAPVGEKA